MTNSSRGKGGAGRQLERLSGSWFPPGFGTSDPIPRCFPLEDFGGFPSIWGSQSRARVGSLIEESQPVARLPPQKCSRGTIICNSSTMNPLEYLSHFLPACVGCVTALLLYEGKQTVLSEQIVHSLKHPKPLIWEQTFHTHSLTILDESILITTLGCINIWPVREPQGRAEGWGELQLEIQ